MAVSGDTIAVGDSFEQSSGRGINGPDADSASPVSGAVYVYRRVGGQWLQEAFIKSANSDPGDRFGEPVDLQGDQLVVGAAGEASGVPADPADNSRPGAGAVYVFRRTATTWAQDGYLKSSVPEEGDFLCMAETFGDLVVAGAYGEDSAVPGVDGDPTNNAATESGAAFVFQRGAGWTLRAYLKASNPGPLDHFGIAMSLGPDALVIGAPQEDGPGQGIDPGDQGDVPPVSEAADNGAAYVFR